MHNDTLETSKRWHLVKGKFYSECCCTILSVNRQNVVTQSVIVLSVVMLSVSIMSAIRPRVIVKRVAMPNV